MVWASWVKKPWPSLHVSWFSRQSSSSSILSSMWAINSIYSVSSKSVDLFFPLMTRYCGSVLVDDIYSTPMCSCLRWFCLVLMRVLFLWIPFLFLMLSLTHDHLLYLISWTSVHEPQEGFAVNPETCFQYPLILLWTTTYMNFSDINM